MDDRELDMRLGNIEGGILEILRRLEEFDENEEEEENKKEEKNKDNRNNNKKIEIKAK